MHYLWMAIFSFVIVQIPVFCTTIFLHRTRLSLNSMINSLGHVAGYRNFDEQAARLQRVAMLTA
jgi:fatty-acid desaturase